MRRVLLSLLLGAMVLPFAACSPLGSDTMKVTALMSDSAGLFVGNDVGILGVTVGKVTSIEPEGTHVRVTMEVSTDHPIPAGAGAVVVARSVATDRYVELTPVYRSGPRMADGAVIQQPRTRTPVDFDTVLAALNTLSTGIAGSGRTADAVGKAIDSGATALRGRGRLLNRTITSLSAAVDGVAGQRGNITATLRSLDTLTRTLATNQQTVRDFISQVSRASALLADERANFRSALRSLSTAVQVVAEFAKDNRQRLTVSLDRSTRLMRSLLTRRGDLSEILRVMPVGLQNLERIYTHGYVRVVLDPSLFTPLGGIVETVCTTLPLPPTTCSIVGPQLLDLQGTISQLGGLVGGRQ